MRQFVIVAATLIAILSSCSSSESISNDKIRADLAERVDLISRAESYSVFSRDLTDEQRQALEVLFAYMPLPDIADNSADFFLENVEYALRARHEMPWGESVPMLEFRHFVLPVRVNNEALDGHRRVFYEELRDRVKGLSMADAILEVNHWCHEKATYQPSDGRTHSPLATVYTAIGRCGEESTFTVAALRAVGIPARQVYTPRWAHTDDNHAWVEAWADGQWYFLGACEPEPVLNLGWFNAPARRGMLMNTRAFGDYDGSEETLLRIKGYTDINVTDHYAAVDTIHVTVVGADGSPIAGARVSYRLYNYAEYYPIATKTADAAGHSSLVAGHGDLLVWATDGNRYGWAKATVGSDHSVTVTIGEHSAPTPEVVELDIVPPAAVDDTTAASVPTELATANERRKAAEDSIRAAYTATFLSADSAASLAAELGLDASRLQAVMADARGNHAVIAGLLSGTQGDMRQRTLTMLEQVSTKDRSDITSEVVLDHLTACGDEHSPLFARYVLNPRIAGEHLTPWRRPLAKAFEAMADSMIADPTRLVTWVKDSIDLVDDWSPASVIMTPRAVYNMRATNEASRNVFFVAAARAIGIPAQIDPVTSATLWADPDGRWHQVSWHDSAAPESNSTAHLKLDFTPTGHIDNPRYWVHFTLSRIVNGEPQLLNFDDEATWRSDFDRRDGIELEAGRYMLTTGQRLADGSVLARTVIFDMPEGSTTTIPLIIRQDAASIQVIGSFDAESIYHDLATDSDRSLLSTTGRGYYVLALVRDGHEPSNHLLRDLAASASGLEAWGGSIMVLFPDEASAKRHSADAALPQLPANAVLGCDIDGSIASALRSGAHLPDGSLPIVVVADTFGRVVFASQGYAIGLGERIADTLHHLK